MSKHTPGPWTYQRGERGAAGLPQMQRKDLSTAIIADGLPIAEVHLGVREANARLIAAAPDLLARLEDCAHQLRQAWACIEHIKEHAPDYERNASIETLKAIQMVGNDAEAAIAKAKGES